MTERRADKTGSETYDVWFRREIQEALDDNSPGIPHDEVAAEFAARRVALQAKLD